MPQSARRSLGRGVAVAAAVVAGSALVPTPAAAHIVVEEGTAAAGAPALASFAFTHGCAGSPTTEIRIQMPESVPVVAPTLNANWDVDKVVEELDAPIAGAHGEQVTERVSEVVYTAREPMPDGYRDVFVLSFTAPDLAGETIYFPTIQSCEDGEHAWIEIPVDGEEAADLSSPAPSLSIVEASEDDHDHSHSH